MEEKKDYIERCKDTIKQTENKINISELKRNTINVLESISSVISITKKVYDEMINQGFNEIQAYEFACKYTLEMCFKNSKQD